MPAARADATEAGGPVAAVLVTGAAGFIGRRLVPALARQGWAVRAATRRGAGEGDQGIGPGLAGVDRVHLDLARTDTDPGPLLHGVDAVVHLAAHVHVTGLRRCFAAARFRQVNADGTRWLALAAARAGVRRFLLLSSVGVNGSCTGVGNLPQRFDEDAAPHPCNAYSRSKLEAEAALRDACREAGMEFVILRAPLVFGPGNRGNFLRLMRVLRAGIPLPLGAARARRSLMYVDNLVDVIGLCLSQAGAANRLFLAADGDMAVSDLVRRLAAALECRPRLWPCPAWLEAAARHLPIAGAALRSLTVPLLVDSSRLRETLKWQPAVSLDAALTETGRWYLGAYGRRG